MRRLLLSLLLTSAVLVGQRDTPLEKVTQWKGVILVHAVGTLSDSGGDRVTRASSRRTAELEFKLEERDGVFQAISICNAEIEESSLETIKNSRWSTTTRGSVRKAFGGDVCLKLDFRRRTYDLTIPSIVVPARCRIINAPDGTVTLDDAYESETIVFSCDPLEGETIGARRVLTGTKLVQIGGAVPTLRAELYWRIWPAGEERPELVVQAKEYYSWMPAAGPDERTAGSTLALHATLETEEGKPPKRRAKRIRFEILDCSKEQGLSINFPADGGTDEDLRFEPSSGMKVMNRGQLAETPEGEHFEAMAIVGAYDGGAHATLKVTAEFDDETVVGHLEGERTLTQILLPRRSSTSKTADAWKKANGVGAADDGADDDGQPTGDGCRGDGLSLYEEYRGFHEGGRHVRGNPNKKEVFVLDLSRDSVVQQAVHLFGLLTELEVHGRLTPDELDSATRVINRNGDADQHAIVVHPFAKDAPDMAVPSAANVPQPPNMEPQPGTPKMFTGIRLRPSSDANATKHYLLHEMCHCCRVRHHGDSDRRFVNWQNYRDGFVDEDRLVTVKGDDGQDKLVPSGQTTTVLVLWENGAKVTAQDLRLPPGAEPLTVYVADPGGEHSGDDQCVMKYSAAHAYIPADERSKRYFLGHGKSDETLGVTLCDSPRGTGINDPSRKPRPRHGPATQGNCKGRICVNDSCH